MTLTREDILTIEELLDRKLQPLSTRLDSLETRMESLETRMESLETRIVGLESRMDKIEHTQRQHTELLLKAVNAILSVESSVSELQKEVFHI